MSDITEQGPVYGLAAARILKPSGSTLTPIDLFYPNQVTIEPETTVLSFEGGEKSQTRTLVSRINLTVALDKHDADAVQQAYGKTRISGPDDEVWSMNMGDDQEVNGVTVGFEYELLASDESVSPAVGYRERYYYPRGTMQMMTPQTAQYQTKNQMVLTFSMERTTVDAANQPLDGVNPSGSGILYRMSRVAL